MFPLDLFHLTIFCDFVAEHLAMPIKLYNYHLIGLKDILEEEEHYLV